MIFRIWDLFLIKIKIFCRNFPTFGEKNTTFRVDAAEYYSFVILQGSLGDLPDITLKLYEILRIKNIKFIVSYHLKIEKNPPSAAQ